MCKIRLSGVLKLLRIKAMLFLTLALKNLQLKESVFAKFSAPNKLRCSVPFNPHFIYSWYRTLKTNLRLKDVNFRENAGILPEVLYVSSFQNTS